MNQRDRESQWPALPCATDEDQIPVLIVALDPELGNVPVAPSISGAPEDDTPLAVGEYNARGRIADICSWSVSLPPWRCALAAEH